MTAETLTEVAEALNRRYRRRHGGDLPPLLMLTDEKRLPDPLAALGGLPEGSAVILRHYGLTAGERRALAAELRAATRKRGILLLIAGDEGLARETEADGVHLPERAVRPDGRMAGRFRLVTAAAHSAAALERAARAGADAALLSPVFPTASHPGAASIGVERAAAWAARAPLPVYALGGVSHETARRLLPHPFAGIAGVGIFAAQMP
ncbi:MAG: thiamine phosphate synthase [Alphaproteobacteria bacterium]